ncbi:MAG: SGNH/GDSL hydrolase family protein [Saprospiraceae bacterium]
MKSLFNLLLLVSLLLTTLATCNKSKPKILIIGDSISIGYTPFVKENLIERAEVYHNPGNAQHTGTGVNKIEEWLGDQDWDIIQFNWGLWDLCYRHPDSKVQGNRDKVNGAITYQVEDYAANLDSIVILLKQNTEAKLIFVSTTYVPAEEAGRFVEDPIRYNIVAKKIMEKHSIDINDIYEESKNIHQAFGKGPDDVHYSKAGYEKLGLVITQFLEKQL